MQSLEFSGAVRPLKWPLGVKWLVKRGDGTTLLLEIWPLLPVKGLYIEPSWVMATRFPTRPRIFTPSKQTGYGVHLAAYPIGTKGVFSGGQVDQLPPSIAQVKNARNYRPYPLLRTSSRRGAKLNTSITLSLPFTSPAVLYPLLYINVN
jgi:hypothetical protein